MQLFEDGVVVPKTLLRGVFSEFEKLIEDRFPKKKTYRSGEHIVGYSEIAGNYCYYVKKGVAGLAAVDESGSVEMISLHGEGMIFPLFYSYRGTSVEIGMDIFALENMEVILLPRRELKQLLEENPAMSMAMMNGWGMWAAIAMHRIQSKNLPVVARVCDYLLLNHVDMEARISQTDMARFCGCSRENATRALSLLHDEGLVTPGRCVIKINSIEGLVKRSSFAYLL